MQEELHLREFLYDSPVRVRVKGGSYRHPSKYEDAPMRFFQIRNPHRLKFCPRVLNFVQDQFLSLSKLVSLSQFRGVFGPIMHVTDRI